MFKRYVWFCERDRVTTVLQNSTEGICIFSYLDCLLNEVPNIDCSQQKN